MRGRGYKVEDDLGAVNTQIYEEKKADVIALGQR